jgi:hypothetical protein
MNRELKFRAWDGNQMLYEGWNKDFFVTKATIFRFDRVMQFIGRTDKNGKNVYEGDIIKCTSGCPHVVEWREEIGGAFIGGMPGWYLSDLLTGNGKGYAWTGDEEVIGNIHETPELISHAIGN